MAMMMRYVDECLLYRGNERMDLCYELCLTNMQPPNTTMLNAYIPVSTFPVSSSLTFPESSCSATFSSSSSFSPLLKIFFNPVL